MEGEQADSWSSIIRLSASTRYPNIRFVSQSASLPRQQGINAHCLLELSRCGTRHKCSRSIYYS
jgi:hypothetical protein